MKQLQRLTYFLFLTLLCITACKEDDLITKDNNSPNQSVVYSTANLVVKAVDENGNTLSGVTIEVFGNQATTNQLGIAMFNNIDAENGLFKVKANIPGYAPAFSNVNVNRKNCYVEIKLMPLQVEYFNSTETKVINFSNSDAQIIIPANSFVDENENIYTGQITAKVTYITPNQEDFGAAMPGSDFMGVDENGDSKFLISYGAINAEFFGDNEEELNLGTGKNAHLVYPIPQSVNEKPNQIPMWHFDETLSIWVQEGVANLDAGNKYIAQVSHFSWWNCDIPADPNTFVSGRIVDCKGTPKSGLSIKVGPLSVYTDIEGFFISNVAPNITFTIKPNNIYFNEITIDKLNIGQNYEIYNWPNVNVNECPKRKLTLQVLDCNNNLIYCEYNCIGCLENNQGILIPAKNEKAIPKDRTTVIEILHGNFSKVINIPLGNSDYNMNDIYICDSFDSHSLNTSNCSYFIIQAGNLNLEYQTYNTSFFDVYSSYSADNNYFINDNNIFQVTFSQPENKNDNQRFSLSFRKNTILDVGVQLSSSWENQFSGGFGFFIDNYAFYANSTQYEIISLDQYHLEIYFSSVGLNCVEIDCLFENGLIYNSANGMIYYKLYKIINPETGMSYPYQTIDLSQHTILEQVNGIVCVPLNY